MPWTSLLGTGLQLWLSRRSRLLADTAHWQRNTGLIQRRELRSLLGRARDTEFGRSHDFARLAELPDRELLAAYRKEVPTGDWYAYRALIQRMREGAEPDVLWPGLVRDFAQTSGTTAGDKFIPVTREMLRANARAATDIFATLVNLGQSLSWITSGRVLFLGGSTDLATSDKGIRTGDLSGIVTPSVWWPASRVYSPGMTIALMSHWPSKIEAMAEACLSQDVRMVCGMPSWGIVLFDHLLAKARERGRPAATLRDVWPNFRIFVHGGVRYQPFEPRVRQLFGGAPDGADVPVRFEVYPASEGFVAMQDAPLDPSSGRSAPLRLCSDRGLFYEFVPLERIGDPAPEAFAADEVVKGQKYVVVVSSCAGMWRYILGDVVEFETVPDRFGGGGGDGPARLRIVGRHLQFMNAFGENLIAEHIENGVSEAAGATGLMVGEFTAAPVYPDSNGRGTTLELAIEFQSSPDAARVAAFGEVFDARLRRESLDYNTKRTDGLGMASPRITPLPMGTFHRWLEAKGKLGGQHKCPRCANHRNFIDEVVPHGAQ